jgi:hypothetical protein
MAKTTRPPRARVRGATQPPPPEQEIGNLNADGTVYIDQQALSDFIKTQLGPQQDLSKVKFVARNAPFNRRSQTPPA